MVSELFWFKDNRNLTTKCNARALIGSWMEDKK